MTKRQAAISVICTYNWCNDGCPMRLSGALCHTYKATDDVQIGKEYRQMIANEWRMIGGATVL